MSPLERFGGPAAPKPPHKQPEATPEPARAEREMETNTEKY